MSKRRREMAAIPPRRTANGTRKAVPPSAGTHFEWASDGGANGFPRLRSIAEPEVCPIQPCENAEPAAQKLPTNPK